MSTQISPYSFKKKYLKNIFNQHQHLVLILFIDLQNQYYRDFSDDGGGREQVQQVM
jgi:predicted ABC-type exoprotein transport system permease subunit